MRFHPPRRSRSFAPLLPLGTTTSDDEYSEWYDQHAWNPTRYAGLTMETDLTPAQWLEPLLVPGSFEVWMTAPQGYEAYARIFFPFIQSGLDEGEWYERPVRWTDLARANAKTTHALMEQETISGSSTGAGLDGLQCARNLSPEQFAALLPIVARHTASEHGWFLLWDGFGDLNDQVFNPRVPKVSHTMRDFYLLRGPLDSYVHLAGHRACIEEVLAVVPIMDGVVTRPENPARSGMDVLNDPDGAVPRSP